MCVYIYIYIYIYIHIIVRTAGLVESDRGVGPNNNFNHLHLRNGLSHNGDAYTRSPSKDFRLFGPRPWKVLATTYETTISEQPIATMVLFPFQAPSFVSSDCLTCRLLKLLLAHPMSEKCKQLTMGIISSIIVIIIIRSIIIIKHRYVCY